MEVNRETPGFLSTVGQVAKAVGELIEADRKKLGGMTLGAHARLGLAELREAVSHDSSIAQSTPYGMWGTLTPGEIAAGREADPQTMTLEPRAENSPLPSPSEIAEDRGPYGRDDAHAALYGEQTQSNDAQPTPGDIADDHSPDTPEQDHGLDHGKSRKR
jgi:hypothetical protein